MTGLLKDSQIKRALEEAKSLHRQHPSPSSESLLVDAYLAKIEAFSPSMAAEAEALLDLVEGRYPHSRSRTAHLRQKLDARSGRFEDLLRPLVGDSTPKEVREEIGRRIREDATDLDALAACASLPEAHPLRVAASAIQRAFAAVTGGPVENESLSNIEVSRRSPLAPCSGDCVLLSRRGRGVGRACRGHRSGRGARAPRPGSSGDGERRASGVAGDGLARRLHRGRRSRPPRRPRRARAGA